MERYVGFDVHCKKITYVVQDNDGKILSEGEIPTSVESIHDFVKRFDLSPETCIGLESGTQHRIVANALTEVGMHPIVVDASEVRRKARRRGQKTDRRDAFEICDNIRRGTYNNIVWVPDKRVEQLRRILSRRRHFVRLCTREVNATKFLLRRDGIPYGKLFLCSETSWERLIARQDVAPIRDHIKMHAQLWRMSKESVAELENELFEAIKPFAEIMQLLMTIPGVGQITAATYIGVLGTPDRFEDSRKVVSYIGLAPSTYDSGEKERHGSISKQGSSHLRAVLCEAAQHARKSHHPLHPYFARIMVRNGYKKAVVAVALRLARIMYRMWKDEESFDIKRLNVVPVREIYQKKVYFRMKKK
jgi:transposase